MADNQRKELLKGLAQGRVENRGQLDKDVFRVKGDQSQADVTEPRTRVRGTGTEKIDTKNVGKMTSGEDFAKRAKDLDMKQQLKSTFADAAKRGDEEMMGKLRKIASRIGQGAKGLPVLGALAAGLGSEDASAALPILGAAEALGPQRGTLEGDIEAGEMDEERMKAMARRMALQNKLMRGE